MMISLSEALGWIGSLLYVIAYLLLTLKKLQSDSPYYHLLNILGATGLIINAFHWRDFPSLAVNIVWLGIGVIAIFMMIFRGSSRANKGI